MTRLEVAEVGADRNPVAKTGDQSHGHLDSIEQRVAGYVEQHLATALRVAGPTVFDAGPHDRPRHPRAKEPADVGGRSTVVAHPPAAGFGEGQVVRQLAFEEPEVGNTVPGGVGVGVQRRAEADDPLDEVGVARGQAERHHTSQGVGADEQRPVGPELRQEGGDGVGMAVRPVPVSRFRRAPEPQQVGYDQTQ